MLMNGKLVIYLEQTLVLMLNVQFHKQFVYIFKLEEAVLTARSLPTERQSGIVDREAKKVERSQMRMSSRCASTGRTHKTPGNNLAPKSDDAVT